MKKVVIFVQGAGANAYQADNELVTSLKRELGPDYEVKYPRMPNEDYPDEEAWKARIRQAIAEPEGQVILVGHSAGGYLLLKSLSGAPLTRPVAAICIVAAPYPGADEQWQFEGFDLPENFGAKLPKEAKKFLYHSADDEIVPFAHMDYYAKAIPEALVRKTAGGHQLTGGLSLIAQDIKGLSR